jgi:hypothetical protein
MSSSSLFGLGLLQDNPEPRAPAGNGEIANQVIHLSLSAGGGRNFVGSTSGVFLASLLQATGQPAAPSLHVGSNSAGSSAAIISDRRVSLTGLPPRNLAADILCASSSHDRLKYPFLAPVALEHALESVYNAVDDPDTSDPDPFHVFLLHMALAIGMAQAYKLDWNGIWNAEIFYHRASAHLADALARGGITSLQALLLICQYRVGTPSNDTTASVWRLIGIAVRICFELGMHRASTYTLPKSTGQGSMQDSVMQTRREEIEVKRRCFWSVVAMDRIASLVLGRPLAIQLDDVDVDLPQVDRMSLQDPAILSMSNEDLTTARCGSIAWNLSTAIFVYIVRYRIVCGKILNALHRSSRDAHDAHDASSIRRNLTEELQAWHAGPPHLHFAPADDPDTSPTLTSRLVIAFHAIFISESQSPVMTWTFPERTIRAIASG